MSSSARAEVAEGGPLRAAVRYALPLSPTSSMTMLVSLAASSGRLEVECSVDWHESHRVLKVRGAVMMRVWGGGGGVVRGLMWRWSAACSGTRCGDE